MNVVILFEQQELSTTAGYVIAAIIALFMLGYLIYYLVKPENF